MKNTKSNYRKLNVLDIYDLWSEDLSWKPVNVNLNNISFISSEKIDLSLPDVKKIDESLTGIRALLNEAYSKKDVKAISNRFTDLKLTDGMQLTVFHMNSGDEFGVDITEEELNEIVGTNLLKD